MGNDWKMHKRVDGDDSEDLNDESILLIADTESDDSDFGQCDEDKDSIQKSRLECLKTLKTTSCVVKSFNLCPTDFSMPNLCSRLYYLSVRPDKLAAVLGCNNQDASTFAREVEEMLDDVVRCVTRLAALCSGHALSAFLLDSNHPLVVAAHTEAQRKLIVRFQDILVCGPNGPVPKWHAYHKKMLGHLFNPDPQDERYSNNPWYLLLPPRCRSMLYWHDHVRSKINQADSLEGNPESEWCIDLSLGRLVESSFGS
jgi:hypothetical protein